VREDTIFVGNGTLLVNKDKMTGTKYVEDNNVVVKLRILCTTPKGSAFQQLQQFRKLVPELIKAYYEQNELACGGKKQLDRVIANTEQNRGRRWTEEEENWLIDLVVSDTPILEISTIMGRSASAITNKVSKLVGLQRISQQIAGKFFGTINGETVVGEIEGTVQKKGMMR
jgi:hypothetical protein